jgi:hypothetical protein
MTHFDQMAPVPLLMRTGVQSIVDLCRSPSFVADTQELLSGTAVWQTTLQSRWALRRRYEVT